MLIQKDPSPKHNFPFIDFSIDQIYYASILKQTFLVSNILQNLLSKFNTCPKSIENHKK